jgi:multicomponent Na+:H+ antiporter subunit D
LQAKEYLVVAAALIAGLLTLMSMIKIWEEVFWKPAPEVNPGEDLPSTSRPLSPRQLLFLLGPIAVLAGLTVAIGLQPHLLFTVAERAAAQLLDPSAYVQAVLGVGHTALQPIGLVQGATF